MLKYSIALILTTCMSVVWSQSITYELRMPKPQDHYYHVTMKLQDFDAEQLSVKMPVWTPGSYLVREFAKNVDQVIAYADGKAAQVQKTSKNTWEVTSNKAKEIKIEYQVYAFEVSVRTCFLDLTHGFVSGSGAFMYVDGYKDKGGILAVYPHPTFSRISTSLEPNGEGVTNDSNKAFVFDNYDQLIDCPLEIGNQDVFTFKAAGVEHTVAMYGSANYDVFMLQKDMAKIVTAATDVFGKNPNKKYTFIIHNVVNAQGGLEHNNSCVLSVNRWSYQGSKYIGFLSLVAHEYFHLWNVKRMRPKELGPFDYDNEVYTSLLWVMEGFTSYYDELLLRRAGYYSQTEYLGRLFSSLNYVEGTPGARVQPVAHSSFDAWIKAYRPNENSRNTTISYYPKGAVLASLIDAMIIKKYKATKCLDHFMRHMYGKYYEGLDRGFTEAEFKQELETFLSENLDEFWNKYIDGTEIPPYRDYFSDMGVSVNYIGKEEADVGMSLESRGGKTLVQGLRSGSAAETGGISVGDEIIGCNGLRAEKSGLDEYFNTVAIGDNIELLFAREDQLFSTEIVVTGYEQPKFSHRISANSKSEKMLNYWLRVNE